VILTPAVFLLILKTHRPIELKLEAILGTNCSNFLDLKYLRHSRCRYGD
jgi:hypothetical protein